jgi:hypothetical protein
MKKLLAIFALVVLCGSFAFAQYTGGTKHAEANFDVKVIAPLHWTAPENVTLKDVVSGTVRDFTGTSDVKVLNFGLTGEPSYDVTINHHGPSAVDGVTLVGPWSTIPTALDNTGAATETYTCTGIDATNATSTGSKVFTISVDAVYTSL